MPQSDYDHPDDTPRPGDEWLDMRAEVLMNCWGSDFNSERDWQEAYDHARQERRDAGVLDNTVHALYARSYE